MILQRIQGERFSRVLPAWKGGTVALLAGGPSLTREQFGMVQAAHGDGRLHAIAINDSYLLAPWADVHFAADGKWHGWHNRGFAKPELGLSVEDVRQRWKSFGGQKATIQGAETCVPDAVHVLRNRDEPYSRTGFSPDPSILVTGKHSGFMALNIAILAGASTILLLGYDARRSEAGKTHWHGDHPIQIRDRAEASYDVFRRSFSDAELEIEATGVRVFNCSPCSAIDTFPRVSLEEALAMEAA